MSTLIKFVGMSKNSKTGCISQTYSSKHTCPTRCPFKGKGCYAENFHCAMAWKKVEESGVEASKLREVIDKTPHTSVIRHNVAGDLAKAGTSDIDTKLLAELNAAYKGLKAYTYTHCEVNSKNLKAAKDSQMVINFSCETIEQVTECHEAGIPVVLVVETMSKPKVTKDDIKFTQCPATLNKSITCATCGKCWNKRRKDVVVFPVHGNGQGKAKKAGFLINL